MPCRSHRPYAPETEGEQEMGRVWCLIFGKVRRRIKYETF
jgi:hypothetical protein